MAKPVGLHWNKCSDGSWAPLLGLLLDDGHFDGLEGVYVIWHGGAKPEPVMVGQGLVRQRLALHREDPELLRHKDSGLFVSWARLERPLRDGVERFLAEALRPKLPAPTPSSAAPLEANLPGHLPAPDAIPGSPGPEPNQPGQAWEDLTLEAAPALSTTAVKIVEEHLAAPGPDSSASRAVPTPPAVKRMSQLQDNFNTLVAAKPAQPRGFFGASAAPKPSQEDEQTVLATVQLILKEAVKMRASDIHLEPQPDALRVRFRIDGILEEMLSIPASSHIRVVSHVRVCCGLDPERGIGTARPEDGRMHVTVDGTEADLRLSTFPTAHGDKAVLRIIPREINVPKLDEMGLRPETATAVAELARRPQGMIIVTGPTGSGKSTTLYTILQTLNDPTRNIVTLEDPIEKKILGISQGMVQPKAGFTFSDGLRAILRQDPNIIMVGEIRDLETAEIAMSAALTGHMLFTTLHTNSALGAITRLLDMGLEPFLISSALTAVFAQRLARRICQACRVEYAPSAAEIEEVAGLARRSGVALPPLPRLYRGKGCGQCRQSGYHGRVMVFELVKLTPSLRRLILEKAPLDALQATVIKDGAQTLIADGVQKAAEGITSLAEVVRVVGVSD